jgi:hypothetical protein
MSKLHRGVAEVELQVLELKKRPTPASFHVMAVKMEKKHHDFLGINPSIAFPASSKSPIMGTSSRSHMRLLIQCDIVDGSRLPRLLLHTSEAAENSLSTAQELAGTPR